MKYKGLVALILVLCLSFAGCGKNLVEPNLPKNGSNSSVAELDLSEDIADDGSSDVEDGSGLDEDGSDTGDSPDGTGENQAGETSESEQGEGEAGEGEGEHSEEQSSEQGESEGDGTGEVDDEVGETEPEPEPKPEPRDKQGFSLELDGLNSEDWNNGKAVEFGLSSDPAEKNIYESKCVVFYSNGSYYIYFEIADDNITEQGASDLFSACIGDVEFTITGTGTVSGSCVNYVYDYEGVLNTAFEGIRWGVMVQIEAEYVSVIALSMSCNNGLKQPLMVVYVFDVPIIS